jgi:hypothetical protein
MYNENSVNRQDPTASHDEVDSTELTIRAQDSISQHSRFRGRANGFTFALLGDTLVVRGTVPSYYLKQLLQTALKDLQGIRHIDNQVVVTTSTNLIDPSARKTE